MHMQDIKDSNLTLHCLKRKEASVLHCTYHQEGGIKSSEARAVVLNVQRSIDRSRGSIPLQLICRQPAMCIASNCVNTVP